MKMPEDEVYKYVCYLSPEMEEVARIELRETENRRDQALEQFRQMIKLHPRIKKCQTDSVSLLRFLRVKKYSVLAAMEMLENHLIAMHQYPLWYTNLNLENERMSSCVNTGHLVPLIDKDRLGRLVVINVGWKLDVNIFTSHDIIRQIFLYYAFYSMQEDFQVAGLVLVLDASNASMKTLSLFTLTDLNNWLVSVQKGTPIRLKAIHLVNFPSVTNALLKVGINAMGPKIKKRIFIHSSKEVFEKAFDTPDILPSEYGGSIPISEMIIDCRKNIQVHQKRILAGDDQEIEIVKQTGEWLSNCDQSLGLAGSFRKLEVD